MRKISNENLEWMLVAKENGKEIAHYPCPNEIIGSIIALLFEAGKGEICSPNDEIREGLKKILGEKVTLQAVSNLTGLSQQYLETFLSGEVEPTETKKIMALTRVIDSLTQ